MKKTILTLVAITCILGTALAQKEVKYEKIFYKNSSIETSDVTITIDDAVSTKAETKLKLKIENKSNDYIIFKPEESAFTINGKEMKPKEKWLIIAPHESDYRVINLKGENYNKVKTYSFNINGLYKIVLNAKGIPAPDFKLPPSQNDFKAGDFSCLVNKFNKETDGTEVKFNCKYTGSNIGFVFPSKVAVKMPDGNEYANAKSKANPIMLMKGQDDSFVLHWNRMEGGKSMDMQFAEMWIKWNEAFVEATPEKMKSETVQVEFDEVTSNEKGQ